VAFPTVTSALWWDFPQWLIPLHNAVHLHNVTEVKKISYMDPDLKSNRLFAVQRSTSPKNFMKFKHKFLSNPLTEKPANEEEKVEISRPINQIY